MRVVVLGAGYAGLTVVRRLERRLPESVELLLVDESDEHLLLHELHRIVRRPELAETITLPLATLVSRAEHRRGRVTDVDTTERVVTLADGRTIAYDAAAVCLGSETAFYGLPGVEAHATPLKRLTHASEIRDAALAAPGGEAVVGGAGLSGIQLAGELAALSHEEDLELSVTVVEAAERVAPAFDVTFADALSRELETRGVAVETGVAVESATGDEVTLVDGSTLPADVFAWTGGIRGPDALGGERQRVNADLQVAPGTFVLGDAATVVDEAERRVPASAQTAVRQARTAAWNIAEFVERHGDDVDEERARWESPPERYRHEVPGWVVSVGDGAVAQLGRIVINGEPARAAKAAVGAGHLGSVGAVGRASRLVASEFGWPTPSCTSVDGLDALLASLPTDPALPGAIGYPLADLLGLAEPADGELVDLTR